MRKHLWVGIVFLCVFSPQNVRADFADGLGIGARAMAMGSAYTAVSDDLSAIYYNPAGLAQIEDHELLLGYLWSNPCLQESSSDDPSFHAEHVAPYNLSTPVIGLGFNLDKTFKGKLPIHTRIGILNMLPNNFKSIYRLWDPETSTARWIRFGDYWDRVYLLAGLSLQSDKIPWLSVGIGFRYIVSGNQYLINRNVTSGYVTSGLDLVIQNLVPQHISVTHAEANVDMGVDTEITPTAGVIITPTKDLRLGYSFHEALSLVLDPLVANAEARLVINGRPRGHPIPLDLLLTFEGYYWPEQHNFGVSYCWDENLLVSLQLSWFRWSKFTSLSRGAPDPKWKDSLIPRLGIEYYPRPALALRCGYFFEPSPVPDQVRVSNYIDNDRHVFSIGAGYTFLDPWHIVIKPMSIDLVFQYIHMPTRTTTKESGFSAGNSHSYEASGDVFSFGGNLTFRY